MLFIVLQVLESGTIYCCLLWLLLHFLLCKCLCRHTGVGLETALVLMSSEKLPLCFGWCHVLDSALSCADSCACTKAEGDTSGSVQWWLILEWFKVSVPQSLPL